MGRLRQILRGPTRRYQEGTQLPVGRYSRLVSQAYRCPNRPGMPSGLVGHAAQVRSTNTTICFCWAVSTTGCSPVRPYPASACRIVVSDRELPEPAKRASGPRSGSRVGSSYDHGPDSRCLGCRPSIPWPRSAPEATTRHERGETYAPARQQPKAGGVPRGGSLGDTTTRKERRPPAHRYSRLEW